MDSIMSLDYSQYSVLIVDDIPLNILLVRKMLARYPLRVRTAPNGEKALEAISQEMPDLLLLDLLMPGIDGFGVLERLRSNEATRNLRVIILSALNSDSDIVKGFKAGANDFVTKPIIMDRLYSSVNRQLQEVAYERGLAS